MAIPTEFETLGDSVRHHAGQHGHTTALVFEGRSQTYAELDRHSNQVANALRAMGLGQGSRIAHLGKNSDLYFELLFGAGKAGIVLVPVNWRLADPEISYVLKDCEATVLFIGPEYAERAETLIADVPAITEIITLDTTISGRPDYRRWRDHQGDHDPKIDVKGEQIALQLYTSGTTGNPKGAMLRHMSMVKATQRKSQDLAAWQRWTADDVGLIALPTFHIGGTGMGLLVLNNGAKGIVLREFDAGAVLDGLEFQGVTRLLLVPSVLHIVVRHPRARTVDYSKLDYMYYGASPIPLELLRECLQVFGCKFVQMYGMTETCGTFVALPPEDHSPDGTPEMRAAGKPLPGAEVRIVDEDNRPLPPNAIGEIVARWSGNMAGYWKLDEATRKTIDSGGWLHTGDAGYIDERGYVFIQDRVKDMIISGGENIYPTEVENAIFGHPAVEEVAVIGVPDAQWGEAVKAVIVPKNGQTPAPGEIIAWARERIAGYKVPKSVDFVASLPRNATGKVLRRALREPYWKGFERQVN